MTPIEDFAGRGKAIPAGIGHEHARQYLAYIHLRPHDIDSRYFTQDARTAWCREPHRQGIGVATPVIDCVITVTTPYTQGWWQEGRSADELGFAGMSLEQIKTYVRPAHRRRTPSRPGDHSPDYSRQAVIQLLR